MLMLKTVTVLEAISKRRRTARPAAHTGLSKNTIFAATHSAEDALVLLDATANGLTAEQATERLYASGPNTIEAPTKTLARRIADAFIDPFAGILAALAVLVRALQRLGGITGDVLGAAVEVTLRVRGL